MISTQHTVSLATGLQCPSCGKLYDMEKIQHFATCCNQPLITTYNLIAEDFGTAIGNESSIWRYRKLLPVFDSSYIVSLGEGFTPILELANLEKCFDLSIFLKDESTNPTGSFKARGISVAVSKAKELGIEHCIIPTAGNAGVALSAYCAAGGMKSTVIMPEHSPQPLKDNCRKYEAELITVKGLIDACGSLARQMVHDTGGFDMSTLKEPYRLEGKKTIGFEIAEQFNWRLPDVIIYPTGGGTGLLGMWKAFHEMQELGWISGKLPRMVIVQSKNCAPMIELFEKGTINENFTAKPTIAFGLAVPKPFAKDLMLDVLRESNGTAIAVSEDEIEHCMQEVAAAEGLFLCPEGAATYMGLKKLVELKWIQNNESVLLFNTGSPENYGHSKR
jgi:threonine synthase